MSGCRELGRTPSDGPHRMALSTTLWVAGFGVVGAAAAAHDSAGFLEHAVDESVRVAGQRGQGADRMAVSGLTP